MHKTSDLIIVALMTFVFGFQCCDVYHANKKSDKPAGRFIRELKTGCKIKKIEQQSFAKKIMAYEDLDREFYTSLKNSTSSPSAPSTKAI